MDLINRLLLSILMTGFLWIPVVGASEEMAAQDALVILADLSGSMREEVEAERLHRPEVSGQKPSGEVEKECLSKVEIAKWLILQMADQLVEKKKPFGILAVEYVAGRQACYRELIPIDRHDRATVRDNIQERLKTDYPLFNRRTPLGDVMRQVDETILSPRTGKTILLLISDGRESFYDPDSDDYASKAAVLDPAAAVQGPLTETRRLKEGYPDQVHLFTVFLDKTDDAEKHREGELRLTQMAEQGMGTFSNGLAWYREPERIQTFLSSLIK